MEITLSKNTVVGVLGASRCCIIEKAPFKWLRKTTEELLLITWFRVSEDPQMSRLRTYLVVKQ